MLSEIVRDNKNTTNNIYVHFFIIYITILCTREIKINVKLLRYV